MLGFAVADRIEIPFTLSIVADKVNVPCCAKHPKGRFPAKGK